MSKGCVLLSSPYLSTANITTQTGKDHLTQLPSELLDGIFKDVCSTKLRPGLICKALVPFQRRQYRSLDTSRSFSHNEDAKVVQELVKEILAHANSLEHLHLSTYHTSHNSLPLLLALQKPEKLKELYLLANRESDKVKAVKAGGKKTIGGPSSASTAVPRSLADFLVLCTSLTTLTLSGEYDYFSKSFLSSLRRLPSLTHLSLTPDMEVSHKTLDSVIRGTQRLPHLKHLTLDMFMIDAGGIDIDEISEDGHFEQSWDEFLGVEWLKDLSCEQMQALMRHASKAGIKLDGWVADAAATKTRYEEQLAIGKREGILGGGSGYEDFDSEDEYDYGGGYGGGRKSRLRW
jgi:hypothetical protein